MNMNNTLARIASHITLDWCSWQLYNNIIATAAAAVVVVADFNWMWKCKQQKTIIIYIYTLRLKSVIKLEMKNDLPLFSAVETVWRWNDIRKLITCHTHFTIVCFFPLLLLKFNLRPLYLLSFISIGSTILCGINDIPSFVYDEFLRHLLVFDIYQKNQLCDAHVYFRTKTWHMKWRKKKSIMCLFPNARWLT